MRKGRETSKGTDERPGTMASGHVSKSQLVALGVFLMGVKVLLTAPAFFIQDSGTSAWISAALSVLLALLGLYGWVLWIREVPDEGFVPALKSTVGSFLCTVVTLGLVAYLAAFVSWSLRIFSGGAVIGLLPEFPLEVLLFMSIVSALYAAWLGVETVARAAQFFLPITLISLAFMLLASYRLFDFRNLLPIWGLGTGTTLRNGFLNAGVFGTMPAFAVMRAYVRKEEDLVKGSFWGTVYGGLFLIVGLVTAAAAFPYPLCAWRVEPLGVMVRAVYLGPFLQRFEALFMFAWFFSQAIQASFMLVVICLLLSQMTGTHTYRPFIPALFSLVFGVAAIPESMYRAGVLLDRFLVYAGNGNIVLGWVLFAVTKVGGSKSREKTKR